MNSPFTVATLLDQTLFHAVVDSAADGIIVTDHAGTIRFVNPAAGRMFGYDPHELPGCDVGMLLAEPGRNESGTFIEPSRDRAGERLFGKPRVLEARRKDGSGFPIHLAVTQIHEGDLHLFAGIVHYRLTLRTRCDGDTAQIEVEDNGPGMDEQTRKRVFEPFFTTKPAGIGTGLGLSVSCFIITEQHRGTLSVTSTPGKGARFVIRLPLGRAAAGQPMHGLAAAAGGG